tara:strand:- start:103 stop:399 length:297 start_codon:yes stop_codon:yes gene_type:complete
MIKGAWNNVKHKILFWKIPNLKDLFVKYGLPFFIILIVWEIIEDVIFPIIFLFLGNNYDPIFYTFMPATWLICLHPIAVPILWAGWCYISRNKDRDNE